MSFAISGSVITQTGTDTDLSGLAGIAGVTIVGSSLNKTIYTLSGVNLVITGNLIIDPDFEEIIFDELAPFPNIDNRGTLQIGRKNTINGKVRYSTGTALTFLRRSISDYDSNTMAGLKSTAANTFIGYGGDIHSNCVIGFGGQENSHQLANITIEKLGIYTRPQPNGILPQVRFDNNINSTVNVSGLSLDSDPSANISLRGVILFVEGYTSFSANFINYTLQSYAAQAYGLRFDDVSFLNNVRDSDVAFNRGGQVFAMVNCDKGSSVNKQIVNTLNNGCHFAFYGTLKLNVQDLSYTPIPGINYYIKDVDDGNRFAPIGYTGRIASLLDSYGNSSVNVYSGQTDASGLAQETILLSTFKTNGTADTLTSSDYSNGGSYSDEMVVSLIGYLYGIVTRTEVLRTPGGTVANVVMLPDALITEPDKAAVDAYSSVDTPQQFYDSAKSFLCSNFYGETETLVTRNGNIVDLGDKNLTIDAGAMSSFVANSSYTYTIPPYQYSTPTFVTLGTYSSQDAIINVSFTTGVDITTGQVIFESGGAGIGIVLGIRNGNLESIVGSVASVKNTYPISANTSYHVTLVIDLSNNFIKMYAANDVATINDLVSTFANFTEGSWCGTDVSGLGQVNNSTKSSYTGSFLGTIDGPLRLWTGANDITITYTSSGVTGFTIKSSVFTGDLTTTGLITLANGALVSGTRTDANGTVAPPLFLSIKGFEIGSDVIIYDSSIPATGDGTNVIQTFGEIATTSVSYVYNYIPGKLVNIGVFKSGKVPILIKDYELGATSGSLPIAQVKDRNYI